MASTLEALQPDAPPLPPLELDGQPPCDLAHRAQSPAWAATPNQQDTVWVADITYVKTDEGFLYVAGVLDCCIRRCIGWAMSDSLASTLPSAALDMALQQHRLPADLVHHSDRSVQHASEAYRQNWRRRASSPA